MTTGEKIKYFRNMRGISQETLGQLSGINSATIKKYEYGIRNPKPDQLLKIANALGVSINVFTDFDIETASDVLSVGVPRDRTIRSKMAEFAPLLRYFHSAYVQYASFKRLAGHRNGLCLTL